jgi:hypothetical protein
MTCQNTGRIEQAGGTMDTRHQHYYAYLLRLWTSGSQDRLVWRASLENPHTGERLTFTTLRRLFDFLEDQCVLEENRDIPADGIQE